MKLLVPILFAAAATVFAAVEPFSETEPAASVPAETPPAGVMRSGPLLPPLTPDEVNRNPVAVPEPVWASVLAACAVSLLRRGRR